MKTKIPHLTFAALLTTSLASQAEVLYQSDFTSPTADLTNTGLTKSAGDAGGSWEIDTTNDQLDGVGGGNARSNVSTIDAFALADGYKGYTLDATFRWTDTSPTRFDFGLVDGNYTISRSGAWLSASLAGAYGVGFSSTIGDNDGLFFNNGAGTRTTLSTAQGDITTATQTMSMIVTDESWSYSLNGAAATTGTHTFDTSRSYRFSAHAQSNNGATFDNITITAVRPEWEGSTGNWDTGFTHGASNTHTIAFSGAGGTATNNIADTTLTNVHDIEFMSGAGAYTLAANAGSAGASGGTALIINGSVINNSANAQNINTALEFAATRTVEANTADITIGGLISGAGGLTKEGTGTLTLSGANTYSGTTTVSAGTLQISGGGSLSTSSAVVNNANLIYGTTTASDTYGLSSSTTGTGTLTGTAKLLQLNGDITQGTVNLTSATDSTTTFERGIELVSDTTITADSITLTGDLGRRGGKGGTLALDTSGTNGAINLDVSIGRSGDWYGLNSFTADTGTGTLTVSGANAGSGGWRGTSSVSLTGTLDISSSFSLSGTGAGKLDLTATGNSSVSGDLALANTTNTWTVNPGLTMDVSGAISGTSAAITKNGTGTLTLSAANTYSGGTTLNSGTLIVGGGEAIGTGTLTLNGGTLRTDTAAANLNEATVVSGTVSAFSGAGGSLSLSGDITGSGTLNLGGSGSGQGDGVYTSIYDTLDGFNGTLSYDFASNANFGWLDANVNTSAKLVTTGETNGNRYLRLHRGHSYQFGELSGNGGIIAGDGVRLTLNQNTDSTYGGHLANLNGSQSLSLTKNGSGTLELTFANTYRAGTTVNNGTLLVNNTSGSGTGTGSVTVNSAGTIGGSGAISGDLIINGVIAPGNSPGTLTTGNQTWNNGGTYLWEINDSDGSKGLTGEGTNGWDWLDITGALDLTNLTAGGFTIDIDSLTAGNIAGDAVGFDTWTKGSPGDVDYSFIIATFDSLTDDYFDAGDFTLDSSGFTNGPSWDWQIKLSGNDLVLEAYAVPEPSSAALLGLGGLALMLRRKRS
jgi:fibronectin-binding autotransporter adhesin